MPSPDIDAWETVRHHENGKVYQGLIRAYSDGGNERELLLAEVKDFVQPEGADELALVDEIPVLYLGLDRKNHFEPATGGQFASQLWWPL